MKLILTKAKNSCQKFGKTICAEISEIIKKIQEKRIANSENHKKIGKILLIIFPFFIVCMAEINQGKTLSRFLNFFASSPSIMIFNFLLWGAIFMALLFLFKRGWLTVVLQSVVMFGLSVVELFKFNTNGNHIILTDMKLFKSVKSLTSFAYIKITPLLITYFFIVLAFAALVWWLNPSVGGKFKKRIFKVLAFAVPVTVIVGVPAIGMPVYKAFGIDTTKSINNFVENEKFVKNSFLAFFAETATENFFSSVKPPENYSQETMDALAPKILNGGENFDVKPNVIVVMSEAFADFRKFEGTQLAPVGDDDGDGFNDETGEPNQTEYFKIPVPDTYDAYDRVAAQGYRGTAVVPTFASFTVRTEFELNFGLPVRSIGDPNMPQRDLQEREQATIPRYYEDNLGYASAYVHPFLNSFYSRSRLYPYFGFDKLLFDEDFTVPVETYESSYISDKTVFEQVEKLIEDEDKPMFIHTTTMQNHQPYNKGENPDDELKTYMTWLRETSKQLEQFTQRLSQLDEPTVVLFVGDHFPSLRGEGSVYNLLGINGENCQSVYEQNYLVWANYDFDYSALPNYKTSVFYLPYAIIDAIGAPQDSVVQTMLEKMRSLPVYSTSYAPSDYRDNYIDSLTYDRIIGKNYTF